MKITILTPSYNQGKFIEENILSVKMQLGVEVEHIIIDGGSTDNTIDVLKKYPHLIWISEKDEGQADALQKGLLMASGDIIGWINSDDYLEENILHKVETYFQDRKIDWLIGNLTFFDQNTMKATPDKSIRVSRNSLFSNPDIIRQQPTFFRKTSIFNAGGFCKQYHLTMDIDLWFRLLRISQPLMVDENFAYFRVHEDQKTSDRNVMIPQMMELLDIFRKNDASALYMLKLIGRKIYFALKLKLIHTLRSLKII
jgi:glycosyltransferase involved in cell wall biosynthesis